MALDQRRQVIDQPLDMRRRAALAQHEAHLPHQLIFFDAHRQEDMAWLLLTSHAGTAAARTDADLIQIEQDRVAVQPFHRE